MLNRDFSLFSCRRAEKIAPSISSVSILLDNLVDAWHRILKTETESSQEREQAKEGFYAAFQGGCLIFGVSCCVDYETSKELAMLTLEEWKSQFDQSDDALRRYFSHEFKNLSSQSKMSSSVPSTFNIGMNT